MPISFQYAHLGCLSHRAYHFSREIDPYSTYFATYKDQKIVSQIGFADPGFFNMFSFPLLKGDKNNLLNDANSIVITQKYAKTLFGNEDPIGQI